MGTRSQAFTAKIKNLQELQLRLVSGSVPQPQGHEVANSLKYFRLVKFTESTTLFIRISFSIFSCMFLNPNNFFQFEL